MAGNDVYVGDVGTIISLETGLTTAALAGATITDILVSKPDKTEVVWHGALVGTAIEYTIVAGDLNKAGQYKMQVHLKIPTWDGKGSTVTMKVLAAYKENGNPGSIV